MTREISGASDILRMLLHFQNQIRLYHWGTKLYPRHVASGELYEKVDSFNDKFVEIYQGKFNGGSLKGVVPFKYESIVLEVNNIDDFLIIESLNEFKIFLADDLYKWLSNMPHYSNTDLKNLVDELMGNVNQTLYLFTLS
jgi:hypothetical protein